jgi:hypothetical protein
VLAVNVFVLAGVAYNRSGTPTARMVLTARELPLAWGNGEYGESGENTGVSLRLDWNNRSDTEKSILSREELESVGFRFPPAGETWDMQHRKSFLDRKAYAVFEYNGEAWAALLKARQASLAKSLADAKNDAQRQRSQQSYDHFEKTASRLVLVGIGLDPAALRGRYPDGGKYLIAKVKVAAYLFIPDRQYRPQDYEIHGRLAALLPDALYVPRQFHALIEKPGAKVVSWRWKYDVDASEVPPYQVTLAYGQRYEPWVEEVAAGGKTKNKEPLQ